MTSVGSRNFWFLIPPCHVRVARPEAIASKTDLKAGQVAGGHGSPNVVDYLAEIFFLWVFFAAAFSFRGGQRLQSGDFIAHEPG